MGVPEVLIIVVVLIPIYLPFYIRKKFPERLWIGILLSLFSGTAQFYLPTKAWMFFLLSAGVFVLLKTVLVDTPIVWFIAILVQVLIMYKRFVDLRVSQEAEKSTL